MKRIILFLACMAALGILAVGATSVWAHDDHGDDDTPTATANPACENDEAGEEHGGESARGPGRDGTEGNDDLNGDDNDNEIDGNAGDDEEHGDRGDDDMCGDEGDDDMNGGPGDDNMAGGPGDDVMDGGAGDDHEQGDAGDDRLTGARGNDVLEGGKGNDHINARDGHTDRVKCGPGKDTVRADRKDHVSRDCEKVRHS